ncbi:S1 family peptidase [Streptomyces sp. NPDC060194]|uniref:S1 family peptidase n=1 Tax=Streptomyces sp. NPDC060194 TaxID=3347069 RepID=UPI003654FE87
MSHRRIPRGKAVLATAGAVGVAAAAVLLPSANASQSDGDDRSSAPRTVSAASAPGLVAQLSDELGGAYAGAWFDARAKRVVVNVAGEDAEEAGERVREAGAVARTVRNSMGELRSAKGTLSRTAAVPGTAWAVDPRTNQVLVTADRTVTGERWDRLESAVDALDDGVARIERSAGRFTTLAEGGDAIFGGGSRCSLGFNVTTGDGSPGFLTAGHCGVAAEQWSDAQGGAPVGTVQAATFPGSGDLALVTYDDPGVEAPGVVDLGDGQTVPIVRAAEAAVGLPVFRMGSTTGLADGVVTGLDATVNYAEGSVSGLIQTNVCAEPGDSGGPLFTSDGSAIGLTSGGSGDCTVGGETFFQPVTTALAAVGATIGEEGAGDAGAGDEGAGDAGADDAGADDPGQGGAGAGEAGAGDAGADDAGQGDAGAGDAGEGGQGAGDAGQGDVGEGGAGQSGADEGGGHGYGD